MKNLLLSIFLFSASSLAAQDLISYVPADASFLFSWNAGQVGKKVNTRQLLQQESVDLILQELVKGLDSLRQEEYFNLMSDPEAFGISSDQSMHLLGRNNGSGRFYAFLFPVFKADLLEGFAVRQGAFIEEKEGYKLAQLGGYYLAWNQTTGIFADGEAAPQDWDFDIQKEDDPYYEEEVPSEEEVPAEEVPAEEAPVEEIMEEEPVEEVIEQGDEYWYDEEPAVPGFADPVLLWVEEILTRSFERSLQTNPDYLLSTGKPADAHLWLDYKQLMAMGQGGLGKVGGQGMAALGNLGQFFEEMYQGVFLTIALNFNQGSLEMNSQLVGPGKMVEVLEDAYDTRFNRKMLKYVDARELLGFYSVRFDVEDLMEGLKDMLFSAMADVPEFGDVFTGVVDVLDIVIDEDALYDLFKGDILFAMTGIRQSETPVITYEYDENFNPGQVEKSIKKQYPEFVVMASYGNEENVLKLVRLAESFDMALDMGNYYQVPGAGEGDGLFFALRKGLLLITNDATLIQEKFASGVEGSARLGKPHRRNLVKNVQAMYWDTQLTWEALGQTDAADSGTELVGVLEMVKDRVKGVSLVTSRKKIRTRLTLELVDKESNALEQLLSLINQVVLEAAGLERI